KERLELRAKECLMYGYAIVGQNSAGEFTAADTRDLVKLVVLFRNGLQFGRGSLFESDLMAIEVYVHEAMVCRVDAMAGQSVIKHIPTTAIWKRIPSTACFESTGMVGSKPEHYLVNILTGTVLLNGIPPGRLPLSILQHPTFTSYFGTQDFDVVTMSTDGDLVYRTSLPCGEVYFEFTLLHQQNNVRIRAIDAATLHLSPRILELVMLTDTTWLKGLPIRLLTMHSHWVDFKSNTMVFRARSFQDKAIAFIATLGASSRCFEIPLPRQHDPLDDLLGSVASMVYFIDQSSCPALVTALAKFEATSLIHTMQDPSGALRTHLPRYGLTFQSDLDGRPPRSVDYSGYHLASSQQLHTTLPFFQHYLVLECTAPSPGQPDCILLVPQGSVVVKDNGFVQIQTTNAFDATLGCWAHAFSSHSNQLGATCVAARLQLAAIFAASSSCLPDPDTNMTGSETALNLVRQCWVSRPFTPDEATMLASVVQFAYKEPALAVVCAQLTAASQARSFLHGVTDLKPELSSAKELVATSTTELRAWMKSPVPWNSCRRGLSTIEQRSAFHPCPKPRLHDPPLGTNAIFELPPPPVGWDFVPKMEQLLLQLVTLVPATASQPFPMRMGGRNAIGDHVLKRLKASWVHHQNMPTPSLLQSNGGTWQDELDIVQKEVQAASALLETYLRHTLVNTIPPTFASSMQLLRACNRSPSVLLHDWLIMAVDGTYIAHFNPFWTPNAAGMYQRTTRLWLAVLVLKSRVNRLCHLAQSKASDALVIRELQTTRTWSVDTYPHWLVFEVEGSLQIRPEQTTIALHLLNEPSGTLCQLNMGLGKTRVILPMLVLQYVAQGEIPRVHLLSSILHEALDFLHLYLTASTLGIRLVEQPFHR
ncbi:hypothetical protein As57867_005726, partial [Aphanomyces stellatus]